jgi:hypothetical protein
MSRIVVRDDAAHELAAARDFYDTNRPGYGSLFADAVDHAFGLLAEYRLSEKKFVIAFADWRCTTGLTPSFTSYATTPS